MSARTVTAFVISCDARRCKTSTGVHATEGDAWIEWRLNCDGMLFCAGIYDGTGIAPREYLCGKHWHVGVAGHYMKGAAHASSKAA